MKVSELSKGQRQHLVWRLDAKTAMGLLTASRYARGEAGDLDLTDIFRRAGKSDHSAKIHSRKVINFVLPRWAKGLNDEISNL